MSIDFPLSGDPERDRREAALIELQHDRMDAGDCPNGCGHLTLTDAFNSDCPKCGFHMRTNTPRTGLN